jgi:exosortase
MNDLHRKIEPIWKTLVVSGALCFLYAFVLMKLGVDWWTDENYSHGLLVPFVIGFIVWNEFSELRQRIDTPRYLLGGLVIVGSIGLLLVGTLGAELFLQRFSLLTMIAGIVMYFWGTKLLQALVVPFALFFLAIPIPQIIFNKIAFPLQIWASQMAVWGIRIFEVASVRKGNVIEILPRGSQQIISLEVVEACSGIRSLMTLVTLALILAYFTRERRDVWNGGWINLIKSFDFWRTLVLMFMAIPIAIVTNGGRVTATAVLTYKYGKQALDGFAHASAGWIVYVVALILLILINIVLVQGKKLFFRRNFND